MPLKLASCWKLRGRNPHLVTQVVPSPYTLKIDRTVQKLLAEGFVGELQGLEVRANAPGFLDREKLAALAARP
jgi:hypothetical protein